MNALVIVAMVLWTLDVTVARIYHPLVKQH